MHRLLLILCLLVATGASVEARRVETSYVTLTDARATTDARSVAVELTIDQRSWRWMRERNIKPILTVWLDDRRTELEIRSIHDTILVPLPGKRRDLYELRIAVGGRGGRTVIGSMMIGGIEVTEITLKVSNGSLPSDGGNAPIPGPGPNPPPPPAPPPPPPNWSANPAIIKACGDIMTGSSNVEACLDATRLYAWSPEPMLRACARAMTGSTSTLACIRSGAAARSNAVNVLDACGRAMTGSTNTMQCFDTAVRSYLEPSPAITACARAMTGSTNTLACIAAVVDARTDPTLTITSCRDAMTGDSAVIGCLKRAFGPR